MAEETTEITLRLPRQDVEFVRAYAEAHGVTMAEVIDRHLRQLRALEYHSLNAELDAGQASADRIGFLKGQMEVPDDFDRMGEETILAAFEGEE